MKTNKIKALLALAGKKSKDFEDYVGITRQAIVKKRKKDSYSADDLIAFGKIADAQLAYIDHDHNILVTFDTDDFSESYKERCR